MRSLSFTVASHLLRTCQAPSLLTAIRHRWTCQLSKPCPQAKSLPMASNIRRKFITTQETKDEVEGQMEYASANDPPVDRGAAENAIANAPKLKVDTNSGKKPQPLPQDHISALEEVKQRLNDWIDSLPDHDLSRSPNRTKEVVENVFVAMRKPQGSNYFLKVTFDRVDKANALNAKLMTDLTFVFQALSSLPDLSIVKLASGNTPRSEEKPSRAIFSAGADVREMSQIDTPAQAEAFIRTVSGLCTAIRNLPALVIAQIDGLCVGAALELAASCDLRYATENARFSMPEVHLGIPSVVQARLLCDIVGWARARDLMLTGDTWSAQQALDAGLVSAVFNNPGNMNNYTTSLAAKVLRMPQAYKSQKRLMRLWEDCSIDDGIEASVNAFTEVWENDQTKERATSAMKEVLVKKPPQESLVKNPPQKSFEKRTPKESLEKKTSKEPAKKAENAPIRKTPIDRIQVRYEKI